MRIVAGIIVGAAFCIGLLVGRLSRETPEHHMNNLISVGFKIIDPEGYDVERWDE